MMERITVNETEIIKMVAAHTQSLAKQNGTDSSPK